MLKIKTKALTGDTWKEIKEEGDDVSVEKTKVIDHLRQRLIAPNVIILAGSGSSLGDKVKGPSMKNLGDAAEQVKGFKGVRGFIGWPGNIGNEIEKFLSACVTAESFYKTVSIGKSEKIKNYRMRAEAEIFKICSAFVSAADLSTHEEFLVRMARRSNRKSRLKVFTTNYDRCFENAASNRGLVVIDGFSFSQPREYSPNFFHIDIIRKMSPASDVYESEPGVFHLYKIHGSVDWDNQGGRIIQNSKPEKPVLVYPAATKYESSYQQPYLEMMGHFLAAIREPNTLIVTIGFGFNDDHLSQPIRSALETNINLNLIVVDRSCEAKDNQFHAWVNRMVNQGDERISLLQSDFDNLISILPDLSQKTTGERLVEIIKVAAKS